MSEPKTEANDLIQPDQVNIDPQDNSEQNIVSGNTTTEVFSGGVSTVDEGVDANGNTIVDLDLEAQSGRVKITQDLTAATSDIDISEEAQAVLKDIESYSEDIKAENFAGKGSLEDYQELFQKVCKYSQDLKDTNIDLTIDMDKLSDFAESAKALTGFIGSLTLSLRRVVTVSDITFLKDFKEKIYNISLLYKTIGDFQTTIIATANLKVPGSVSKILALLQKITSQINNTMTYMDYFTGIISKEEVDKSAYLTDDSRAALNRAISALDTWKALADAQTSTSLSTDKTVQDLKVEIAKYEELSVRAKKQLEALKKFSATICPEGRFP